MALVKALEANTAALLALNEALAEFNKTNTFAFERIGMPKTESPIREAAKLLTKKQDAKDSAPSKAMPAPAAENPASTAAESVAATSTSLSYDDIKTPFLELAKRDLAAAQALIAEFGFKTLKDAKPEQYAEIMRALTPDEDAGMA